MKSRAMPKYKGLLRIAEIDFGNGRCAVKPMHVVL